MTTPRNPEGEDTFRHLFGRDPGQIEEAASTIRKEVRNWKPKYDDTVPEISKQGRKKFRESVCP